MGSWHSPAIQPTWGILGIQSAAPNLHASEMRLLEIFVLVYGDMSSSSGSRTFPLQTMELTYSLGRSQFLVEEDPFKFFLVWDPFLDYVGEDVVGALRSGPYGSAWAEISMYLCCSQGVKLGDIWWHFFLDLSLIVILSLYFPVKDVETVPAAKVASTKSY